MKDGRAERIFCASWHAGLAVVGLTEFAVHRSRLMKVLAIGFAAFHVDAAINDWRGQETWFKRGLRIGVDTAKFVGRVQSYGGNT